MANTAANHSLCTPLGNFYWAVGDEDGLLGSGQIGNSYDANTRMPIFSASKLVFSTYVVEKQSGLLDNSLIKGLNFTSGYDEGELRLCMPSDTVGECFTRDLDNYVAAKDGQFFYASGHMQKIAAMDLDLYDLTRQGFANEIMNVLGTELDLLFHVNVLGVQAGPLAAGAMNTTPAAYSEFLRKIVAGEYEMKNHLGANTVSADGHGTGYSLGHWVEANPDQSVNAYSSVGALGVYPWIDSTKTYWGILARVDQTTPENAASESLACGSKMRESFLNAL